MDIPPEIIFATDAFSITARGLAALIIAIPFAVLLLIGGAKVITKALTATGPARRRIGRDAAKDVSRRPA